MNNSYLVINTRFLTQSITGVQRFAIEISRQLKKLAGDRVLFVAPGNIMHTDIAEELDAKVVGISTGHAWEQIDLPLYLRSIGSPLLVNLANTAPLLYKNKAVVVHDVAFERFPQNFDWKFRWFYKLLVPRIIHNSRVVITVSEFSRQEIHKLYKRSDSNIKVVYNAVSDAFSSNTSYTTSEDYILAVSSLNQQKNFHSLVKAYNQLKSANIKLYIVGSINKNFAPLDLLSDIEGNSNIVMKGRVNDHELASLYSGAKCFVFPSFYEGFGIPPLEAQACGCPVVCSNAASLPEVGGDSVAYCDPYSVDDIFDKIKMVVEDESLQQALRQKGYQNIRRFSWRKSAEQILKIVSDLK